MRSRSTLLRAAALSTLLAVAPAPGVVWGDPGTEEPGAAWRVPKTEATSASATAPDHGAAEAGRLRVSAARRTLAVIERRGREHRARLAARVRDYYKKARFDPERRWLEPEARRTHLVRRSAAARLLARDLAELAILGAERDAARAAVAAARDRLAALPAGAGPSPQSLIRPVPGARAVSGFGEVRHPGTGAWISRRGIRLATRAGTPVLAVAPGRVLWSGALAGTMVVAIDHPARSIVSVIADLEAVLVAPGQEVAAGQPVARAAGTSIHLEIRLRTGAFGHPVDPAPLLDR